MSTIRVRRITTGVGAEITGLDLAGPLLPEAAALVRRALLEHGLVVLREQALDSAQYVSFARAFGAITMPDSGIIPPLDGSSEIAEVRKDPGRERNVGGTWHTDQCYRIHPSWGTMLLARKLPSQGGDTLFAGMSTALDGLSPALRATLRGLRGVHSNAAVQARMQTGRAPAPDVVHPVLARHPETGREILYVNPAYTVRFEGWTEAESRPLLEYLFQHGQRPEYTCRLRWEVGTLAFWDNYQTWHFAVNDYPAGERVMHRIVVNGIPFGSAPHAQAA